MIPLLTTLAFLLFVLYVEQYNLRLWFTSMRCSIYQTLGRADWMYPVVRKEREWMRRNVVKTYEQ